MSITWPELVTLMAVGAGTEDRLAGTLQVRDVEPLPADVAADDVDGTVEERPGVGRVLVREHRLRVWRRGGLVRTETVDGRVTMIFGADTKWIFGPDEAVPVAYPAWQASFSWDGDDLGQRLQPSRWEGEDFTRLTGLIEPAEWHGRPAWSFELAPPRHKPYPMQLVVDAGTGIVLRQGNRDFGSVTEWLDLDLDAELPDALFRWDGPTVTPEAAHAERDAEHERDLATRRAWLDARGIVLDVPTRPELMLHEWTDESGAFFASFHTMLDGALARRPLGSEPDEQRMDYPHTYRWDDSRWAWSLGTRQPISDEQLALLKVRLGTTT